MAGFDEALQESVVFLDHFADLPDPRQLIKVICPLDEILLLSLLAVMAGAETLNASMIAEIPHLSVNFTVRAQCSHDFRRPTTLRRSADLRP